MEAHRCPVHLVPNMGGTAPEQWPSDQLLTLPKQPNDLAAWDCQVADHGPKDVIKALIPFQIAYSVITQTMNVKLGPLDVGKPSHIYFVNDCQDSATVTLPMSGKAQLVDEDSERKVNF